MVDTTATMTAAPPSGSISIPLMPPDGGSSHWYYHDNKAMDEVVEVLRHYVKTEKRHYKIPKGYVHRLQKNPLLGGWREGSILWFRTVRSSSSGADEFITTPAISNVASPSSPPSSLSSFVIVGDGSWSTQQ